MEKQVLEKHIFRKTVFILIETIFVDLLRIYRIFIKLKDLFPNPLTVQTEDWLSGQFGRPGGRPNQGQVDRAVD